MRPNEPKGSGRERGGQPMRLGDLLSPALERIGPRGLWTEAKLRKVWTAVVGDNVAANAEIGRLRGKVLEVHVSSEPWATELTFLASAIVEKLNARMGPGVVEQLVVRRRRKR